jgi:hypothetical protein
MNFQGMGNRWFCKQASVGVRLGNLRRESVYRELLEKVGGGLRKWIRGTWKFKRWLWRWAPLFLGASLGNLGEGLYAGGLCVEEGSEAGVSPYRSHIGEPGEGGSIYGEL